MKVEVNISLKEGVLDPEGQAIDNTLRNLGYNDFDNIRTGKQIILNIDKADEDEVLKQADKMCQELLVNIVIENYQINIIKDSKIFKDIENNSHMYFVHSYEFVPVDKTVISATTDYSSNIVCSIEQENIFGTQFHPEKSDKTGLKVVKNFISL